jgi:hypothetical protein
MVMIAIPVRATAVLVMPLRATTVFAIFMVRAVRSHPFEGIRHALNVPSHVLKLILQFVLTYAMPNVMPKPSDCIHSTHNPLRSLSADYNLNRFLEQAVNYKSYLSITHIQTIIIIQKLLKIHSHLIFIDNILFK